MPSDRRYTNIYSQMASDIQKDVEVKLGRPLSDLEANSIRNAGSLLMLESVARGMDYAKTAEDVAAQLADAASGFPQRLIDAHSDVTTSLESKLNRPLKTLESELVAGIPNCLVAMLVLHNVEDASAISNVSEVMP